MRLGRPTRSKSITGKQLQPKNRRQKRSFTIESLEVREFLDASSLLQSLPYGPLPEGTTTLSPIPRPTNSLLRYIPNDAYYQRYQWQLKDYDLPAGIAKGSNIEQAWELLLAQDNGDRNDPNSFAFGDQIVIAFNDVGMQFEHPEFNFDDRFAGGCDWTIDPRICFDTGAAVDPFIDIHATAVAGLAIAERDNGIGITGVAPDAHWFSNKLLPTTPAGTRNVDVGEANALSAYATPLCGELLGPYESRLGDVFFSSIDIFNNSWGPVDGLDWRTPASIPGPLAAAVRSTRGLTSGGVAWGASTSGRPATAARSATM